MWVVVVGGGLSCICWMAGGRWVVVCMVAIVYVCIDWTVRVVAATESD